MNKRLRQRLLHTFGCALVLCVCNTPPRNAFAQSSHSAQTGDQAEAQPAHAERAQGVVNINTATAAELERLPRVGPARAQAILALRAKLTRFSKVEQLLRVRGIGRATFRKLRPLLALDGPTTLPERPGR